LDQTRVHLRNYDTAGRIAVDCIYGHTEDVQGPKLMQALSQIIRNPEKLREMLMGDYKEILKSRGGEQMAYIFDQVIDDLLHPFMDFREDKTIVRTPND
jgi:transcriptional accessory protein Tex/SPT6